MGYTLFEEYEVKMAQLADARRDSTWARRRAQRQSWVQRMLTKLLGIKLGPMVQRPVRING